MPGTLFVVATPIGNLEDITLRALRVLREVAVVAAEDTRRSGNLLRHYDIHTPLISLHGHNEHQRVPELLRRLQTGESIAVVSDAGTPGISDPGADLVKAARAEHIAVEPIPGPSSVTAVLSASGLDLSRFAFAGFPPVRAKDRAGWFEWVRTMADIPVVLFEAPHRVESTIREIGVILVNRPIIVAHEVTKLHESWLSGYPAEILTQLSQPQGEYVIVLGPASADEVAPVPPSDTDIAIEFGRTAENSRGSRREAIKATAKRLGLSPKTVYTALERHKIAGE
jgi:16S rRNA (cytidine1402-2'-O)-methyltransferase